MPNSASCEHGFSKLGWLLGKYRINLNTQSLESLAKMSSYYLSNLKKELVYYGQNISTEEIAEVIHSLDFNEIEENQETDKDSNFEDLNVINDKSNDNIEVIIEWHPLHMENFIDLNNPIFTKDIDIIQDDSDADLSDEESENTNSNDSNNESESNGELEDYNYNPNKIAKDIYNNDDITDDNYSE
jgi:hypothetical protein